MSTLGSDTRGFLVAGSNRPNLKQHLISTTSRGLGYVAVLFATLLAASEVQAQCLITTTEVVTTAGGNISVEKDGPSIGLYPPPGGNCMLVMSNSAACNFVNAYALKGLATPGQQGNSPSCSWTCDCGPVSVGPSDGLPVELLEFSIAIDMEDEDD